MSEIAEAKRTYRMPPLRQGMTVNWYRDPKDRRAPLIGIVQKVNQGINCDLFVPGGEFSFPEGVKHVSDPRCRISADHYEAGVWDYTDDFKEREDRAKDVEQRLVAVEERMRALESGQSPSAAKRPKSAADVA